jgi:hypothetical protein
MTTFLTIVFVILSVWLMYEAWRTPLYKQNLDGSWTEVTPPKKLSDLFKRKKR